jgi:translocator protein
MDNNRLWRWTTLIVVLINIGFNYFYQYADVQALTIPEVTEKYYSLFTPAGYAFSIWGLIYLSFIAYCIYQLLPAQRKNHTYDVLTKALLFANILASVWQVVYRNEYILASVCVIVTMLVLATIMFVRVKAIPNHQWLTIPFSLFLGWISVATIANISIALVYLGWDGSGFGAAAWTAIMLGVALLLSVILGLLYRDVVIPLVVAWAAFAIYMESKPVNIIAANAALVCTIGAILCSVAVATMKIFRRPVKPGNYIDR